MSLSRSVRRKPDAVCQYASRRLLCCDDHPSSGSWALPRRCFCSCLRRRPGPDVTWNAQSGDWSNGDNWWGYWETAHAARADFHRQRRYLQRRDRDHHHRPETLCSSLSLGGTAGSGAIQMTGGSLTVGQSALSSATPARGTSRSPAAPTPFPAASLPRLQQRQQRDLQPQRRLVVRILAETSATPARGTSRSPAAPTPISDHLYLGYNSGGSGTYSLSGSGLLSAASRIRRLLRHGQLHAVRRHQHRRRRVSSSATAPAAAGPTASAVPACCPQR